MKSGASDPFAEETTAETDASAGTETEQAPQTDHSTASDTADATSEDTPNSNTEQLSRADLPYKLRRERVKDERDSVHQLFVQDDTDTKAREAERELEDRLDDDVSRLDAREAIYLAGMQNLDEAVAVLRTWGYDL